MIHAVRVARGVSYRDMSQLFLKDYYIYAVGVNNLLRSDVTSSQFVWFYDTDAAGTPDKKVRWLSRLKLRLDTIA